VAVPPIVPGATTPASGNSLATATAASPKRSSTLITLPPGSGMRLTSSAPNASAYQRAAPSAAGTTMCAVTPFGAPLMR